MSEIKYIADDPVIIKEYTIVCPNCNVEEVVQVRNIEEYFYYCGCGQGIKVVFEEDE